MNNVVQYGERICRRYTTDDPPYTVVMYGQIIRVMITHAIVEWDAGGGIETWKIGDLARA